MRAAIATIAIDCPAIGPTRKVFLRVAVEL